MKPHVAPANRSGLHEFYGDNQVSELFAELPLLSCFIASPYAQPVTQEEAPTPEARPEPPGPASLTWNELQRISLDASEEPPSHDEEAQPPSHDEEAPEPISPLRTPKPRPASSPTVAQVQFRGMRMLGQISNQRRGLPRVGPQATPCECVICMEPAQATGPKILRTLPCGHAFHQSCLKEWLSESRRRFPRSAQTCPCCRQAVPEPSGARSASQPALPTLAGPSQASPALPARSSTPARQRSSVSVGAEQRRRRPAR